MIINKLFIQFINYLNLHKYFIFIQITFTQQIRFNHIIHQYSFYKTFKNSFLICIIKNYKYKSFKWKKNKLINKKKI